FRPLRPLVNPGAQKSDLFVGERVTLFGHSRELLFGARDRLNEEALRAFARHEERAGIASLQRRSLLVESEAALLLLDAVALEAGVSQNGLDVFDEINFSGRGRG